MTRFLFVLVSLLLIPDWGAASAGAEPFRPEAGKFPPLEKAHSYRGELIFVDHQNRRGSLRVERHAGDRDTQVTETFWSRGFFEPYPGNATASLKRSSAFRVPFA